VGREKIGAFDKTRLGEGKVNRKRKGPIIGTHKRQKFTSEKHGP